MNIKQLAVSVFAIASLSLSGCAVTGSPRPEHFMPNVQSSATSQNVAHNVELGSVKGFVGMGMFSHYANLNNAEARVALEKSLGSAEMLAQKGQGRYVLDVDMKDTGEHKSIFGTNWGGTNRDMIAQYVVKDKQQDNAKVLDKTVESKTHASMGYFYYLSERPAGEKAYKQNFEDGIKAVQQL
ncbi:hypothetical protein [Zymobacter sp. IVIA_12111.31 C1]|uniref:hypothetical protein n=1 Tax=Zymobacter sp. IVIA_12111.31 C1 TaxID=3394854 RepID=UPI0039C1A1BB